MFPPHKPISPYNHFRRSAPKSGFTLLEILVVIAVIGILATIAFGISTGVKNSQARAKARGELAMIAQALEQFKAKNGDYPWVTGDPDDSMDNGIELFQALLGWREFERIGGETEFLDKESSSVPASGPEPFLDVSKLTYVSDEDSGGIFPYEGGDFNPNLGDPASEPDDHLLIDPWGNPYVFLYGQTSDRDWEVFGYHLYSLGPDGLGSTSGLSVNTGVMDDATFRDEPDNLDNVYAGE